MTSNAQDQNNFTESLRNALRVPISGGGDLALTAALKGRRPADVAEAMEQLSRPEALHTFNWLDNQFAAQVLEHLDNDLVRFLLENAPRGRIADMLDLLPMDDAAGIVAEASPEKAEELLADLSERAPEDAEEVRTLLAYPENSAGRLLTDKFVRLPRTLTVEEAFAAIRNADADVETLNDIYITEPLPSLGNDCEKLLGVISLRDLVRAQPYQTLESIMTTDLVTVGVDEDQEDVARLISKYNFLALPVLDRDGSFAGIITIDDVVDVLVEEQTEDVLKLGAVSATEKSYTSMTVLETVRQRLVWLLLLFLAEMFTGTVLRHFEDEIGHMVALSFFVPLLIGTGGNAGAQTVTTITRALALGEVQFKDLLRVLWREARTGVVLGLALGTIGFFRSLMWKTGADLSLVVGLSMLVIVIWAVIVGSVLPITFKRLGFDPAVMSAPFITTLVDATGLFFYFSIARAILKV